MDKENVMGYIYIWYIQPQKNRAILACAATWMKIKSITLSEMSDRERQILYGLTYMWNLLKKIAS